MALSCTQTSESGPRAKLIVHPCSSTISWQVTGMQNRAKVQDF